MQSKKAVNAQKKYHEYNYNGIIKFLFRLND